MKELVEWGEGAMMVTCLSQELVLLLPSMVAHTYRPSTQEAKAGGWLESGSLKPVWATQQDPVSKRKRKQGTSAAYEG
jgi:hypothetical protein